MIEINPDDIWQISSILLGFQVAALGWRIQKEADIRKQGSKTWFPVADYLNLASMFCIIMGVFIAPIIGLGSEATMKLWFCISVFLLAAYSIALPAHYELFTREGNESGEYFPDQEKKVLLIAAICFLAFLCFLIGKTW